MFCKKCGTKMQDFEERIRKLFRGEYWRIIFECPKCKHQKIEHTKINT